MAGQLRHRVVEVERFAQVELLGIALQQAFAYEYPPDSADDGVSQLRQLGRFGRAHPLKAQVGAIGCNFIDSVRAASR